MAKATKEPMGTKLAEMAKAGRLRGKVCITDSKGVTTEYADEASAYDAWKDRISTLEHRRGAFFVKADEPTAPVSAPTPKPKRA
jgi:hypothetical protein